MRALLILPDQVTNKRQIERVIQSIHYRLQSNDTITISAFERSINHWQSLGFSFTISNVENQLLNNFDIIAYCEGIHESYIKKLEEISKKLPIRVHRYPLLSEELFHPPHSTTSELEYPYLNTHIFNAIGTRSDNKFYYFPYEYLFRCTGMGPTNEFGFRLPDNTMQFAKRTPEHKVIALFGGSAGWSFYCLPNEMFSTLLEAKLNAFCRTHQLNCRFTVLNFSQHGNVCLNEIFNYILFAQSIKPDIVIAHDGFNDLLYGQMSDSYLLNAHQITYQHNLECWSEILHETKGIPLPDHFEPGSTKLRNFPRSAIQAYYNRLLQFQNMVTATGALFISSLQPMVFSKPNLSVVERGRIEQYVRTKTCELAEAFNNMPLLYQKYLQQLDNRLSYFANTHEHFRQFGSDLTLFGDIMHTSPAGDEIVADFLVDYLARILFSSQESPSSSNQDMASTRS
jgi:hypothetical protein